MRITASENYFHAYDCNLYDCKRFYCQPHRFLYRGCENVDSYDIQRDECPKCTKRFQMEREKRLWEAAQPVLTGGLL